MSVEANSPTLEALGWMEGRWISTTRDGHSEERWTGARGGMLVGVHHSVKGGRSVHVELMRIEQRSDGVVLVASPAGQASVEFRLVASRDPRTVTFENPRHDFPKRIVYRRAGNVLHAEVSGDGKSARWSWELVER